MAAKTVLTNKLYKNAEAIFLIKQGEKVLQMQAHKPDGDGIEYMAVDEAAAYAVKAIEERAAALASVRIAETEAGAEESEV